MITSPRVRAATVEPMVAVPIEITALSLMPPRITGSASGSSTWRSRCAPVIPMPSAASITEGLSVVSPISAFSNTGNRP